MKKIYIILGLIAMSTSSCESFLDEKPIDKVGLEQYYTDEAGLTQVLAGVYDILGSSNVYGNLINTTYEVQSDESFYGRNTATGLVVNLYNFTDPNIANYWTDLYKGIERANDLIANINVATIDETKRQQILGEAKFLRGYYYFLLVTHFGDVPLRLTPTTSPVGISMARTPKAQVYEQILNDMKEAEGKVATSSAIGFPGRVSKTVVDGILARVCLYMAGYPLNDTSKYAESLVWSKKVIDSGEHALNVTFDTNPAFNSFNQTIPTVPANSNNAYRQIFINPALDKYDTKECMWEVEFKGNRADGYFELGGLGSQIGITFTPANGSPLMNTIGYCYGFVKATHRLFNSYDAAGRDLRRDWNLATYTWAINNTTNVATKTAIGKNVQYGRDAAKWKREYEAINPKDKNQSGINFPVLRYADVLLMYAEAQNQVNNGPTATALEYVNQVRRRGYGLPIGTPSLVADLPSGLSKAAFQQQAIEDERMRELCFEGLRRLDLIRWKGLGYVTVMNAVGNEIAASPAANPPAPAPPVIVSDTRYGRVGGQSTTQKNLLFPIPSVEMLSNKLITPADQNPGW
ncbi:RagB/SusD family nutrient uptake outer membrane protein [Flavobacterium gilvum]|uniref:Carbohydrate-binding protein SusD n=1 Tax=Flavobacterium gilvum TaxID=1492737 RepID=A0AAC9I8V7_9FLAO|nr:RagB/SusD family nutrient uptake outer membrane protein [Flavobacterium gilvum]AOW10397.1 hypothetical protein EM308_13290 [Flavobacterium gilvum]KFC60269.1 hypothetical protein FEM08_09700 [Flavobacterium gilvum]